MRRIYNPDSRRGRKGWAWADPIRRGWPGPMASWTTRQRQTFENSFALNLALGMNEPGAWAEAWGSVVKMPEGKVQ